MITYIRFRINEEIREIFLKDYITSIATLNRKDCFADCRISECISEPENLIVQLDWKDSNYGNNPSVIKFKHLIALYSDFILEMRNYENLTLSDI